MTETSAAPAPVVRYGISRWYETKIKRKPCGCCIKRYTKLEWFCGQTCRTPDGRFHQGKSFLDPHAARMAFRKALAAAYPGATLVEEP